MKRIAFLLMVGLVMQGFAIGQQEGAASSSISVNFDQLQKKVQKSDAEIQDPKKSVSPKVWYNRGELMESVYDLNGVRKGIQTNMASLSAKVLFGEPQSVETTQEPNGSKKEVYKYKGFELIFVNDKLTDWTQTTFVVDRPLDKAFESFLKCRDLDPEGKMAKKLTEKFTSLNSEYQKDGVYMYTKATQSDEAKDEASSLKNYTEAYKDFSNAVEVARLPYINKADTIFMYYAGFCASRAKKYDEAIKYLEEAKSLNLDEPNMYQLLAEAYIAKGDTAKGLDAVKSGISNLKDNGALVIYLVNFYLKTNNSKEALSYLTIAKKQDPTNKTLFFVEGTLYDKLNDFENAKVSYDEALKLDPNYYDAIFNYGVLYFNHAVKLMDDAMLEKDNKKYAEKKAIADDALKQALPYMEKAREIVPNDKTTLETLKTLYYRLMSNDKAMQDKYNEVVEKLKTVQ